MSCVYHTLRHLWLQGLTSEPFLGGSAPPDPRNWSAAVAASEGRGPKVIRQVFEVMSKIILTRHADLGHDPKHWPSEAATADNQLGGSIGTIYHL